jgi:methionyl-tRNA formyltransferase
MSDKLKIVYFGSSLFSKIAFDELLKMGIKPVALVTNPDKKKGRGLALLPTETKVWAEKNLIPVLTPERLDAKFIEEIQKLKADIFLVASYGKILPASVLSIPKYGCLNIHGSLLPKYRGATPIQSSLLNGDKIGGITLIQMDEKMDHGKIIIKKEITIEPNDTYETLIHKYATEGALAFAKTLNDYVNKSTKLEEQDEKLATYTSKILKSYLEFDLTSPPIMLQRKYRALKGLPIYFIAKTKRGNLRVRINEADATDSKFNIKEVTPESGKKITYEEFRKNYLDLI